MTIAGLVRRLRRSAAASVRPAAHAVLRVPLARRALLAALGVPFDPFAPAFRDDPYPIYHGLRRRDSVHFARCGYWFVTGYAEAAAMLRDPRIGHPDHRTALADDPRVTPLDCLRNHLFLTMNPPDHTRIRRAVTEHFTPAAAEQLRPRVQALADRLLDRVAPAGCLDVVGDLAYPLALGTIAGALGVPSEDFDRLRPPVWTVVAIAFDPMPSPSQLGRGSVAAEWLRDYFGGLLAERRHSPLPDLLTALVEAERLGQLDGEETLATGILLLMAGYETTVDVIGNGLFALLRHPAELQRLRDDQDLIRSAVEELVRYDSPVQWVSRVAVEDVVVGNRLIRRGQQIYVFTGAANRDPARFPDPDRLDITRQDRAHLGFGAGLHACPGQHLARVEAQVAIATLVRRFSRMQLLAERPVRHDSLQRRGLQALPIAVGLDNDAPLPR